MKSFKCQLKIDAAVERGLLDNFLNSITDGITCNFFGHMILDNGEEVGFEVGHEYMVDVGPHIFRAICDHKTFTQSPMEAFYTFRVVGQVKEGWAN